MASTSRHAQLKLAQQCMAFANARQTFCTRSPVLNQLGALTCLVGSSQQQPLPIVGFAGNGMIRALHADTQRTALGPNEHNKASLPFAAAVAAGAALTALTVGSVAADSGESREVAPPEARGGGVALPDAVVAATGPAVVDEEYQRNLELLEAHERQTVSLFERSKASVVTIFVARPAKQTSDEHDSSSTSAPDKKPELGGGNGFFVRHMGINLILTNYHVVEGSSEPGMVKSFASGNVSGLNRTGVFNEGSSVVVAKGAVQTDASLGPDCSGGPLLDRAGRVVGVVKGGDRWAFAVPIDEARQLLDLLVPQGIKAEALMGMTVMLDGDRPGLVVTMVEEDLPAAQAGLKPTTRDCPGDRIIGINGRPVRSYADLAHALSGKGAGDTVKLDILRSHHTAPAGSGGEGSSDGAQQKQQPQRLTVMLTLRA